MDSQTLLVLLLILVAIAVVLLAVAGNLMARLIPRMEAFHRRYMVSNKILRLWAQMARQLDVQMLVPQHGAPIKGRQAINDFFDWIETLMCGVDLFDDRAYQLPQGYIDPVTRQMRPSVRPA